MVINTYSEEHMVVDNAGLPTKDIIGYMQVGYREYGTISLNLIDAMTDCLITINVKDDKEFRSILGDGYYK